MLDHMQVLSLPTLPADSNLLSGLLACPDFRKGFEAGQEAFGADEEYGDDPKTEDDLIFFVNNELSVTIYRRSKKLSELFGDPPLTYVHHIGFVVGYLHQMMLAQQPA